MIIASCLFTAPAVVNAQESFVCPDWEHDPKRARNEIGLNLVGAVYFGYDPLYPHPAFFRLSLLNGVSFKKRNGKNAYRASVDVFRDSFEARRGRHAAPGYYSTTGSAVRSEVRLGIEHRFTSGAVKPVLAIDFVGRHEHLHLDGEGWGDAAWQQQPEPFSYTSTTMRYGISASIGLSWTISKRFSCSAEGGAWVVLIDDPDVPLGTRSPVVLDALRSLSLNYYW